MMAGKKITIEEASSGGGAQVIGGLKSLAEKCLDNYTLEAQKIEERQARRDFTLLFALQGKEKVGFIAGYGDSGRMHIWLFGGLGALRGAGIGRMLLEKFHSVSAAKGYKIVNTITFNKYPRKIILSVRNGYRIVDVKYAPEKGDSMIVLEKELG